MSETRAPGTAGDAVDAERQAAMGRLRDLVSQGDLSVDGFAAAMDRVLAAGDFNELQAVMTPLPSLVHLTPAPLRLSQPLRIDAGAGRVAFGRGWQLAAVTEVRTSSGRCDLDLTEATWDATSVQLRLHADWGVIEVVVPEGVAVQVVAARGSLELDGIAPALPAAPQLQLFSSGGGTVRVRHPQPPGSGRIRERVRASLRRRLR
jgi:DUF1707 SHOCT-like domain